MAIYIEDQNHAIVGYIEGNRVEDQNHATVMYIEGNHFQDKDHETIAYINDNCIEDAENHARLCYINGNKIENSDRAVIGYINGTATDIQKGAGGLWVLTLLAASYVDSMRSSGSSNSSSISGSDSSKKPNSLWGFVTNPIGNIVLGILIAIGLTIFSGGGSFSAGLIMSARIPLVLGIIITAIGVFRLFWRWK